jgi:general stress protein YciG
VRLDAIGVEGGESSEGDETRRSVRLDAIGVKGGENSEARATVEVEGSQG